MNQLHTLPSRPAARQRGAFTLVELIVVMAIIALLAAILIPTIRAAMIRAKVTAIAVDLEKLDFALDKFKKKYGDYPADFSHGHVLVRQVQKAWPRITAKELMIFLAVTNPTFAELYYSNFSVEQYREDASGAKTVVRWHVDPAEALAFWLGGFSENQLHPFTGAGGPFSGTERNPDNTSFQFEADELTESGNVLAFGIKCSKGGSVVVEHKFGARESNDDSFLHGLANDPFPVVLTRGTQAPVVYLESRNYANSQYPPHGYTTTTIAGDAHAYLSDRKLVNGGYEWINPHSYQLISAGLDEDFGVHGTDATGSFMFKRFDSGTYYTDGDFDNVTNSSGGTLEDAIP